MKNKHKLFINMAELVAGQSTCCRLSVGAVLVKDNRVISIGFNGVPSGQTHCEEHFEEVCRKSGQPKEEFFKSQKFMDEHGKFSNENELHAEQNAILFAAKNGIATAGATLYVTFAPCINCAKVIVTAGIKTVYYKTPYDRSKDGPVFLAGNGIECRQLTEEEMK